MSTNTPVVLDLHPTWKQHLCYKALDTPVYDEKNLPIAREIFFGGSAGGGKSWLICESRLFNALRYPGYKSFIGRGELKRLMQSTYVTWIKVCNFHRIPRDIWRLDGSLNVIRFANGPDDKNPWAGGSAIDLLDLKYHPVEDPLYERFGSLEYSDGAIEEAGEVHPLAHEVLRTRVSRWMNKELKINPSLLMTGNPKKNWTYHLFYKPWKNKTLPPESRFIQALYSDNEYGEESYGSTLDRIKDPVMRARLRDGNWEYEDDPSALMNYAAISDLFTNLVADDDADTGERYMTVDAARYGKDKIVVKLWRDWVCYKVLWKEKISIVEAASWIAGLARENDIPFSQCVVDEDGVGGGIVDINRGMRGFLGGSSPIEAEEDEDEEIETNKPQQKRAFANLKVQCAYLAAEKVNNHEAAVRTKDEQIREWLTEDLEQVKEQNVDSDEKKRQLVPKEESKIILGRSPDFGDAFIMRAIFDLKPPAQKRATWTYRASPKRGER